MLSGAVARSHPLQHVETKAANNPPTPTQDGAGVIKQTTAQPLVLVLACVPLHPRRHAANVLTYAFFIADPFPTGSRASDSSIMSEKNETDDKFCTRQRATITCR